MNRAEFRTLILERPLILDGATGTWLQAHGLKPGFCPSRFVLENPDVLAQLQARYYKSGSDIVISCTFGASRCKLDPGLLADPGVMAVNRKVAAISLAVRDECASRLGRPLYVAGDLGPTGQFLIPAGDLRFEELVEIYGEQVDGMLAAGVDLFIVETMIDLAQTRAAVLAVRDRCDLPVVASLTLGENGRSLSGDLPLAALLSLQAIGVDAFGFNCSFGPEKLADVLLPLLAETGIPLLLKPNAGIPCLIEGKTVFPLAPEPFAAALQPLAAAGVRMIGGCCGTGPDHLARLADAVHSMAAAPVDLVPLDNRICSARTVLALEDIGQLAAVEATDPASLLDQAMEAQDEDPEGLLIDCRRIAPECHEAVLDAVAELALSISLPLAFAGEAALVRRLLRQYPGRAAIYGTPAPEGMDPLVL